MPDHDRVSLGAACMDLNALIGNSEQPSGRQVRETCKASPAPHVR